MKFDVGDKVILRSRVQEGIEFVCTVTRGNYFDENHRDTFVDVKATDNDSDWAVLLSRLRYFSPLDEALE